MVNPGVDVAEVGAIAVEQRAEGGLVDAVEHLVDLLRELILAVETAVQAEGGGLDDPVSHHLDQHLHGVLFLLRELIEEVAVICQIVDVAAAEDPGREDLVVVGDTSTALAHAIFENFSNVLNRFNRGLGDLCIDLGFDVLPCVHYVTLL